MKLKILGTAAAEGFPALWCECPTCARARALGGKDIRKRACYLVDDDTLVDCGPDIYWQVTEYGVDLLGIKKIIVTHPHGDHLSPVEFLWRKNGSFSVVTKKIDVYGGAAVFGKLAAFAADHLNFTDMRNELNINVNVLHPGQPCRTDDITILPVKAEHAPGKDALVYVLTRNGRSVFICNDTGYLESDSDWEVLRGRKLDLVLLDATCGIKHKTNRRGHMGADVVIEFKKRLETMGCANAGCRFYATHFSHNGGAVHAELEACFAPHGIGVAYDGLECEI